MKNTPKIDMYLPLVMEAPFRLMMWKVITTDILVPFNISRLIHATVGTTIIFPDNLLEILLKLQ